MAIMKESRQQMKKVKKDRLPYNNLWQVIGDWNWTKHKNESQGKTERKKERKKEKKSPRHQLDAIRIREALDDDNNEQQERKEKC